MSNKAISWAWGVSGLGVGETLVLVCLADRANRKGLCWPGIDDISDRTNMSDSGVRKCVNGLRKKGLVTDLKRGGGGHANKYLLSIEQPPSGSAFDYGTPPPGSDVIETTPLSQDTTPPPQDTTPLRGSDKPKGSIRKAISSGDTSRKKNRKDTSVTKKPRKRAPTNFEVTDALMEFGRKEGFTNAEILREAESFKDHEYPRAKNDWDATFRNWLRKSKQWKSERKTRKKLTYAVQIAEDMKASGCHEGGNLGRSNDIGKLFAVLRSAYGHQWPHQSDAIPIWHAKLKVFSADQIMSAASKAIEEHPDFPPSLGQIIKIVRSECVSNFIPRASTYLPPQPYDKANAEKAWLQMEKLAGRKLRSNGK